MSSIRSQPLKMFLAGNTNLAGLGGFSRGQLMRFGIFNGGGVLVRDW